MKWGKTKNKRQGAVVYKNDGIEMKKEWIDGWSD